MSDGETGYMRSNPPSPKIKLSAGQKLMIAGLICLEIPAGAVFYPLATIIILTGVGAPLSMVFWALGTMPFSLAMKRKAAWQSTGEPGAVQDPAPYEA